MIALALFLAALALAYLLSDEITKPIKALEKSMKEVEKGNFAHAVLVVREENEIGHLSRNFNMMTEEIQNLIEQRDQEQQIKRKSELKVLQSQINPHFLMNALNTVKWMSVVQHTDDIAAYVTHLGYILSYSLGKTDYETTLRTELKVLQNYLELQQTTYDFEYVLDVEEGEYLNQPCARFLLQPVAENSVCHNMDEFGHLWIRVRKDSYFSGR